MTYPVIKEDSVCSHCGEKINNSFLTVKDNFLLFNFFDFTDGSDNIFCSNRCLTERLSVEEIFLEEE